MFKNVAGQKFGRLTAIRPEGRIRSAVAWECRCECGNTKIVGITDLLRGSTQSCGCLRRELYENNTNDLTGRVFGRWAVISKAPTGVKNRISKWNCRCSCGTEKVVLSTSLLSGRSKSCGCLMRETAAYRATKHGRYGTPEYYSWVAKTRKQQNKKWTLEMESFLRELFPCCVICGISKTEHITRYNSDLHIDHIRPHCLGFGLMVSNATVLCKSCNGKKSGKDMCELPAFIQNKLFVAARIFKNAWEGRKR